MKFSYNLRKSFTAFADAVKQALSAKAGEAVVDGRKFKVESAGDQPADIGFAVVNGVRVSLIERRNDRLAAAANGFLGHGLEAPAKRLVAENEAYQQKVDACKARRARKLEALEKLWGKLRAAELWRLNLANEGALRPIVCQAAVCLIKAGAVGAETPAKAREAGAKRLPRLSQKLWEQVRKIAVALARADAARADAAKAAADKQ